MIITLPRIEMDKLTDLKTAYFLSFTRFQIKKDTKDIAKEKIPNVSSLGQGARWVNGQDRVSGWKVALSTIYNQPKRPKTNNVMETAFIIFMNMIYLSHLHIIFIGTVYYFLHSVSIKDSSHFSYQSTGFSASFWRNARL
jgi:hypothetical protein